MGVRILPILSIDVSWNMCNTNTLQHKIRKHTDNGDLIVNFLADTIRGEYPDAKYHHKLEAAKLLSRYDSSADTPRHSCEHRKNTPSPSMGEGRDGGDESPLPPQHTRHSCEIRNPQGQGGDAENPPLPQGEGWGEGENILHNEPVVRESEALGHRTENSELKTDNSTVTHLDILNYDIAHLIRRETADGHTIVQFLSHVMTGPDKPFTPKKLRIRHTDRMAAAREVIRRGFGHFGRKRKLVHDYDDEADAYDTLHTDLAKRMREYTEHGTDAVRFLLDVMEDADPDDPYTWHHRVSAAQELIRRGWDTNYDAITPELLQAYWHNQDSTRLSTGQKKHLAGLPTTPNDYDHYDTTNYATIAADLREAESNNSLPPRWGKVRMGVTASTQGLSSKEATIPTRHSREGRNPAGPGLGIENSDPFVLSLSKDESANQPKTLPSTRSKDGSSSKPEPTTKPPLPQGEGWGEGESLVQSHSPNQSEIPNRHSLKASPQPRSGSGTPAERSEHKKSSPSMSVLPDPDLDCYYEPLNPEDQAIFDHELRLESSDPVQADLALTPPTPTAWKEYELALAQIREAAAAEGIPLLPNPLAGTLKMPAIRSP